MLLGVRKRWPGVLAIVALLMLAAVVSRAASAVPVGEGKPLFGFLRLPTIELYHDEDPGQHLSPDEGTTLGDILGWVVLLSPLFLLAVALLGGLVLGIRWARRRVGQSTWLPEEPGYGPPAAARLLRAAEAARDEFTVHRGGPPGDAVIAAWLRLEEAAEGIGTGRRAHQTPTEFTDALTEGHETIAAQLDRLRRLYHRARFGEPGAVGPAEADTAKAALDEIVRTLSRQPVAP
jgi:Domain of unknown function (DUF4129)